MKYHEGAWLPLVIAALCMWEVHGQYNQQSCGVEDFVCDNGMCIESRRRCNHVADCSNGEDELNCPCGADEFHCSNDGACIEARKRCDGIPNCRDGSDEQDCGESTCPDGSFTCEAGAVQCATRCDNNPECEGGEDELDCRECAQECDGRCLEDSRICDGTADCSDGNDEAFCYRCDGPDDFQCNDGECIRASQRCNRIVECSDGSDESNCNETVSTSNEGCLENQFRCHDGTCINIDFLCDSTPDCIDRSDEMNCQCRNDQFACVSGGCINSYLKCDGSPDCNDGSDETDPECTFPVESGSTELPPVLTTTARNNDIYSPGGGPSESGRNPEYGPSTPNPYPPGSGSQQGNYGLSTERRPPYYIPGEAITNAPSGGGSDRDDSGSSTAVYNPYDQGPNPYEPTPSPMRPILPDRYPPGGYQYTFPGSSTEYPSPDQNGIDNNPSPRPEQGGPSGSQDGNGDQNGGGRDPNAPDGGSGNVYPGSDYDQNGGSRDPNAPGGGLGQGGSGNAYPGSGSEYDQNGGGRDPNAPGNGLGQGGSGNAYPGSGFEYDQNGGGRDPNAPGNGLGQGGSGNAYPGSGSEYDQNGGGRDPNAPGGGFGQGGSGNAYPGPDYGSSPQPLPAGSSPSGGSVRGPLTLNVKTYPNQQTVRYGGDVVFQCRDEGPLRAPVRWVREGGRSLKPGARDFRGRLEIDKVTGADSGVYICQTPRYLGSPGSEVRVTLTVQNERPSLSRPDFVHCMPYEATCGNGECIPKSAVCDGNYDCSDKSDEDTCTNSGRCEPNQFQCDNRKCVLKTWLCDSEDDCGDGSDERSCGPAQPGQPCLPSEFSCFDGTQCVPKSFHCDGRSDCLDKSDEVGCAPVYIVRPPSPANLRLNTGDTLTLRAEAKGNPVPVISWRLNWGHVPPQCTSTSENGIGILTCPNMQPEHSGAYSAEALNNKGTTFANPDAIVFVSQISPCPPGTFNNEARSERECIRCFCFGESTQCRSADLFTYNMPTPLGQGGTRLQGVHVTPGGEVRTDASIANHYYYQPLRNNGATVTKLAAFDGSSLGGFHPYLSLPETYNGQQLTSYGGHIKFSLAPHARALGPDSSAPTVIIKGRYATLFHFHRGGDSSRDIPVEVRLTPENWEKPGFSGFEPAAREDIMMALDQIETILIRADLNDAGVNITDFVMESAQHINIGLGAASLVEECTCPPGYEGLSCQKCSAGYVREKTGPWLGDCVRESCPPGTYGDPSTGRPCERCPCPLTNRENQFARTCSLAADGRVDCDCAPGYEGRSCERCAPGYEGNPLVRGDSCRQVSEERCDPAGTGDTRPPDECVCKENVQGRYCDQCKNNSFYLSHDFSQGCALCFCSGVSQQCMSSNLRRKTTHLNFNVPNIVNQVKIYNSSLAGSSGLSYGAPAETELKPVLTSGGLTIRGYDRSRPAVLYWSMPISFAGDKVTSYGGFLRYTLENVPRLLRSRPDNAADVQLISENHLTFQYTGNFESNEGVLNASVQFLETGWHRSDGEEISREHFLLALADVKAVLVKATYGEAVATPLYASIDTAEPDGRGPAALHVEQCVCPAGYVGTSCEDCAPGYTRSSSGLYLEHCDLCDCNGHSRQCHPETGVCYNCMDNTDGPNCEYCKPGYELDDFSNCVAVEEQYSTAAPCRCDPRGSEGPCDASGRCTCKKNVEGASCDRCRAGTFGLEARNPDGCIACFCSGATQECQEANHFTRIAMAAPILGDDYGGYTLTDLNAENVINDAIVPVPDKSELMYVFQFPPGEELYWSLPVFPGNRVTSYGGSLSLRQEFSSNSYNAASEPGVDVVLVGDTVSVYWTNPNVLRSQQSLAYQVPLTEVGWYRLGSTVPASRADFMRVLKSLRRVSVRATIARDLVSSTIADVSMDTATEIPQPGAPVALGVEMCTCPPGHLGTSCESCSAGYYKDAQEYCTQCPCSGHDCRLDSFGQVTCNCRPPYTGRDCTAIAGESQGTSTGPPPPRSTVSVRILDRDTIRIEEVGSSVNFTCRAQSGIRNTPLEISWTKENGFLPQGRSYVDPYRGVLKITDLQSSDSGVYVCSSSDGVSTGSESVTLKVPANRMTIPTVSVNPALADYYEGDRVVVECEARGVPTPSVSWRRTSNRPLPLTARQQDTQFVIESAREDDSGEYSCLARNSAGSGENIAVINVHPRPSRPVRERLTVTPQAASVNEGQSTRVVCTGTAGIPAGTIDWVRQDNGRFEANVRSDNGVLYIDAARVADRGVYVCRTQAPDVAAVSVLVTVQPVAPPAPADRPAVAVTADSLRIASGDSGTVDCTPSGNPPPRIEWTKHQDRFGAGVSQRGNMLIINDARESDAGYYVCRGFVDGQPRPVGIVYVNVQIERREPPRVQIWPEGSQPAALGSTFEFHCRVLGGTPEPDVTWSRSGGRALSRDTHIRPNNILRFERVDVNDEGEYICTGSNLAGSASAAAALEVRSPPEISITPTNYHTVRIGEPLHMECRATGYPQPMLSIRGPDRRELAPPALGIATIRVPAAGERDDGDYACLATSAAGSREEAFVVRVYRGDAFPDLDGGSGDNEIDPGNTDPGEPYDPYYPVPSGPEERPSDWIAPEGQSRIEIDCPETAYNPRWDRSDRQPLQRNAVQEGRRLVIYNISNSDSGEYVCSIYNSETGNVQRARYIRLVVIRPPKIVLRPPTQTVSPGMSPTVECIVEGDDILSIRWMPRDRNPSRRIEVRNSTLIFHQIEAEDAGQYECFARNAYANASATAEVIVQEDNEVPTSVSHEHEQWFRAGTSVALSCDSTTAKVSVKWTKDGRSLPEEPRMRTQPDGSLDIRLARQSDSGHYVCLITDRRGFVTANYINLHIEDANPSLVRVEPSRERYIAGENVQIQCRARSQDVLVTWEKYGTRQFVESRRFGGGAMLIISGVSVGDAGVYRCTGTDARGNRSFDDFNLQVVPGAPNPAYPAERDREPLEPARYTAHLRDAVEMHCDHDLEEPVNINWRRDYAPMPQDARSDQPMLYLSEVTEADAGTYICRVSNNRAALERRAILRVVGVVPKFTGDGWLALKTIPDAYRQFDIELSFNPGDENGLILYDSERPGFDAGDFIALQLEDAVPQFILETGNGPVYVKGDRPLALNTWHTIRLNRIGTHVSMAVDNSGPFGNETRDDWVLELREPLYVGGVASLSDLPPQLAGASGFVGCVSMLIVGRDEMNMMMDNIDRSNVAECDSCAPNLCQNGGVCQEARNERGFTCICTSGFAGETCTRRGEACHPGLCGSGTCRDTADGYKCACPVTRTGRNCEESQSVEYPAFAGSGFLAVNPPEGGRFFKMSLKVKPTSPVQDGIIMYCAESQRGLGGFTSLAIRNRRIEFRYDLNDGNPMVVVSNVSVPAREWTDVQITRIGPVFSLTINAVHTYEQRRDSANKSLNFNTPMFVGGVDEKIILNANTGVTGGFSGCIKDVEFQGKPTDIAKSHNYSGNVQDCTMMDPRGDIPEMLENLCSCVNGGTCNPDGTCSCPAGTSGYYCEGGARRRPGAAPCAARPCQNGGTCRPDYSNMMNHSCDCPLGFSGANCQIELQLYQSVSFKGDGYLELPANLIDYDDEEEPATVAMAIMSTQPGVLFYQTELANAIDDYGVSDTGDYVLLRIERNGHVVMEWDMGSGSTSLSVDTKFVTDGERHQIIVRFLRDNRVELTVDDHTVDGYTTGIAARLNVDSNIYIGGIPDSMRQRGYVGFSGCIEQVEFMNARRAQSLAVAVSGKNTHRCRQPGR